MPDYAPLGSKVNIYLREFIRLIKLKFSSSFSTVSKSDLVLFTRQFSAMISAGLPLVKSLLIISSEIENSVLKAALDKVILDLQSGLSFSDALAKHPRIFSNFFVSLVKSGEAAGILPDVLKRIANQLEKESELRQKVTSSFTYPIVVGVVACAVVTFLLIFIVPVFKNVYRGLKVDLPLPTLFLIYLSNFMVKCWWLILLAIIAGIFGFKIIKERNKKVSSFLDYLQFRMPVFGRLNRKIVTTRFCRNLAAMLASGITLNRALEVVDKVLNNRLTSSVIWVMQRNINQGKTLTEVLQKQKIFSPIAVQMIATGEQSGTLEEMLNKTADFLDVEIDHIVKRLIVKLEPVLTIILAIVVGYIALAIYLPMFDIIRSISD